MSIDLAATRAKLKAKYKISGWAASHNLEPETVKMMLRGVFKSKHPKEGVYGKIVAALRKDRVLVNVDEKKAA